ncbi:hypothetical protein Tco_0598735 [Tanacetum coccineum]
MIDPVDNYFIHCLDLPFKVKGKAINITWSLNNPGEWKRSVIVPDLCQGPIPNKTHAQALEAIKTMADNSQKWHDDLTSRKKLKENVHAIQVRCETCGGAHLDKECSLHEEVKSVEEVKYEEFEQSFPNRGGNGAIYRVGQSGYYTRVDNHPPFGEKKPSLEELMNMNLEEPTRRRAEIEN